MGKMRSQNMHSLYLLITKKQLAFDHHHSAGKCYLSSHKLGIVTPLSWTLKIGGFIVSSEIYRLCDALSRGACSHKNILGTI